MEKEYPANPALNAILRLLDRYIEEMIKLQNGENMIADPPGFCQKVIDFNLTAILATNENFEERLKEDLDRNEGFDPGLELDLNINEEVDKACEELGIKAPAQPVYEYPFKTENGRELPLLVDKIQACDKDLYFFPYVTRFEKTEAIRLINKSKQCLMDSFPQPTDDDEKQYLIWKCRNYHIFLAFKILDHLSESIVVPEMKRDFFSWLMLPRLWIRYQWRRFYNRYLAR